MTPWPFTKSVDTLSGKAMEVNRDHVNRVRFAGNKVVQCDKLATDGLVHHVSNVSVVFKKNLITINFYLEKFYYFLNSCFKKF